MGLEAKLVQKLSQSLLMTPQLQQAIKLLQLGRLEYIEAIEKELLENPILEETKEIEEASGTSPASQHREDPETGIERLGSQGAEGESEEMLPAPGQTPADWESYLENLSDSRGSTSPRGFTDLDEKPSLEATVSNGETLHDHLVAQLRLSEMQTEDFEIARHIIGNLNRDGYLCCTYEEIAEEAVCGNDDIERVMEIIRTLEPAGVASRDLRECLLTQLDIQGFGDSLESRIVRDHLDKVERRKYDLIAKAEKTNVERVYKAITTIQSLEPRPGRPYADETTRYIIPDIYVYKIDGEWVIALNEDGLPKLKVSSHYLDLIKNKDLNNNPHKAYLNERLKAASWLIKSIHQRQQTIYKVTESIVKFQKEFLEQGITKLKPLVLKDVADNIGMHESTVSRVTTSKYVHTPQGVFELKYFFTTGIKTGEGDVSSSTIKEKIKNLITAEPPSNPISDQQIVEILKSENIEIARRTVAKIPREFRNSVFFKTQKAFLGLSFTSPQRPLRPQSSYIFSLWS